MKKIILIALLVCIEQVNAQTYVSIPDSNFVHYLKTIVPTAMSGDQLNITNPSVTTYATNLTPSGWGISNLSGIEYFTSLTYLDCSRNSLTSLPVLPDSLQYLICGDNNLTILPTLPNFLFSLDCTHNLLTSLPILPNSLRALVCDSNQITSLPPLPINLGDLYCRSNLLTSIPALPDTLFDLYCQNNMITSLPTLPSHFGHLYCDNNQITTLPNLPVGMSVLYASHNQINNCPTLPNTLQLFEVAYNNITCFSPLPNSLNGAGLIPNPFTCLPNYVYGMDSATLAYPLCASGNANGCPVPDSCNPFLIYTLTKDTALPYTWDIYPNYSSYISNVLWNWGDGSYTSGLYPSHTYSVAGWYNICATGYSSCGDSTLYCQNDTIYRTSNSNMVYVNVKSNATGISQISGLNSTISIYPNPNNGLFNLSISQFDNLKMSSIGIYNVTSDCVHRQIATSANCQIDLSNLAEGVYNISLQSNEGVVNKRLVIVR